MMKVMGILCMMLGVAALSLEFNGLRWCSIPATATIIEVNRQPAAKGGYTYNPVFEFCVDGRMIRGNAGQPGSLLKEAAAYKVAFIAGAGFFVGNTGEGKNCMRISYGNVTPEKINEGMKRLGDLIKSKLQEYCS